MQIKFKVVITTRLSRFTVIMKRFWGFIWLPHNDSWARTGVGQGQADVMFSLWGFWVSFCCCCCCFRGQNWVSMGTRGDYLIRRSAFPLATGRRRWLTAAEHFRRARFLFVCFFLVWKNMAPTAAHFYLLLNRQPERLEPATRDAGVAFSVTIVDWISHC